MENVLKNNVRLFLSTDRNEALQASQRGVLSALLDQHTASCPTDQLRVLLCGDTITQSHTGPTPASQHAAQSSSGQLGDMQRKLAMFDSPLSIILVTSRGGRNSCGWALQTLWSRGISVDEVYCLAGAPRDPITSLLRPHFMLSDITGHRQDDVMEEVMEEGEASVGSWSKLSSSSKTCHSPKYTFINSILQTVVTV